MTTPATVQPSSTTLPPELAATADKASAFARQAKADNTARAYAADWRDFQQWATAHGLNTMPAAPETVALYLTQRAETLTVATLQRRLASIVAAHRVHGYALDTRAEPLGSTWAGIRRAHGRPAQGQAPVLVEDVRAMVGAMDNSMKATRDHALILVGFAAALRRSELVALNVGDVYFTAAGAVLTLRRSKTDQEGEGRKVGIPHGHGETCPVKALRAWLDASGIEAGPLFRGVSKGGTVAHKGLSGQAVANVVKGRAKAAGLDPNRVGAHSLRAGLATAAAQAGVGEREIQAQTGHKSTAVLRRYIRDGELFQNNAAASVGL